MNIKNLVFNELLKIKRSNIIIIFLLTLIFNDMLSIFQLFSNGIKGNYTDFINIEIWNSFSMILPAVIIIFSNYLINIEDESGSLKNNLNCGISLSHLYGSKILVLGILNILFSIVNSIFTYIIFLFIPSNKESISGSIVSMIQSIGMSFWIYISVLPIIIILIKKTKSYTNVIIGFIYGFVGVFISGQNLQEFYPITAFLNILNYEGNANNISASYTTILIVIVVSILLWIFQSNSLNNYDKI
ncbi:ABC transporter permease [Apilactobacillus xinyiensis]|uniref:ABC transporter permease n=1 Tax=Apilactobacillus xinyiensis TaxID=2841032 RepID=UPI00200FB4ED|nr:ABC transporter permease [Apilactobacillus xinyiensis]MCL0330809.1 ABC transporter permease [Apilactobacillus xinyiensis]